MSSALVDVAERLRRIEARLERLLASGWRATASEASNLTEDVTALEELGLRSVASAIRRVQHAANGAEALQAVAIALAVSRQAGVRLVGATGASALQAGPEGSWVPLAPSRRAGRTLDRLLPVGRIAIGAGEEAWACIRLHGQWAALYVLVDPPGLASGEGGHRTGQPAWLSSVLEGVLQWQVRYPLGADGSVERCTLAGATLAAEPRDDLLSALRKSHKDGITLLSGSGGLRLRHLDRAEAHAFVWPDPAAGEVLAGLRDEKVWALTWGGSAAIAPLALLSPKGFLKPAALIHLVPGLPRTPLG